MKCALVHPGSLSWQYSVFCTIAASLPTYTTCPERYTRGALHVCIVSGCAYPSLPVIHGPILAYGSLSSSAILVRRTFRVGIALVDDGPRSHQHSVVCVFEVSDHLASSPLFSPFLFGVCLHRGCSVPFSGVGSHAAPFDRSTHLQGHWRIVASKNPEMKEKRWCRKLDRCFCLFATAFPLCFVYGVTLWAYWCFSITICLQRLYSFLGIILFILSSLLYAMTIWSYSVAVFLAPGSPSPATSSVRILL